MTASPEERPTPLEVAIIGSGFAGLCMAIQLKKAGIEEFLIFEKAGSLGGTWRDNTYPGSGCDVPSFLYSFSFEMKKDWSRKFAEQPEILDYLNHCARKFEIEPRIRFDTEIAEARYDEAAGRWAIRAGDGRAWSARVLVAACGQLNRPFTPAIPGAGVFRGTVFHSARWRHEADLAGKRVAVIGNGASALQFVPIIAQKVARLSLFQRSANWIVQKSDRAFTAAELERFKSWPLIARLYRWFIYLRLESNWPVFSTPGGWLGRLTAWTGKRELAKHVANPELRAQLTPDYPPGCKRVLQSSDYYQALSRENVEVVTAPIKRIVEGGVETEDGRQRDAEVLIYATGFETTGFIAPIEVAGRGGLTLREAWKDGADAYLGVALPGFPNFFMLYGPNTNLGHNSIIFMIECQVGYVMQCVEAMRRRNLRALDVRRPRMDRYNDDVQHALRQSVWAAGCSSWYKTGSGKITNNWAYSTLWYWWHTRHPDWNAFEFEANP